MSSNNSDVLESIPDMDAAPSVSLPSLSPHLTSSLLAFCSLSYSPPLCSATTHESLADVSIPFVLVISSAQQSDSRERSPSSLFFDTDNEHLAVSSSGKPCSDKKKKSASRRGSQKQEPEVLVLWDSSDDEGSSQLGRPRPTIKKLKETGKGTGKGKGKGVVGKSEGKKGKKKEEAQLSGGVRSNDGSAVRSALSRHGHSLTYELIRFRSLLLGSPRPKTRSALSDTVRPVRRSAEGS